MAIKPVRICDVTGVVLGADDGPNCGASITIVVPHAEAPKKLVLLAEHLEPELAELLLKACITVITRRGLFVHSNGSVYTEAEVGAADAPM